MYQKSPPFTEPKIELMIVGAQKAGTTSLKNYLGQHPSVQTHPHKEFSYFVDSSDYEKGFAQALKKYYSPSETPVHLLAKNAGLYVSEPGIERLKAHNPDCKLVFILRNPVERTYSSYLMERNYGAINGTFDDIAAILPEQAHKDWRYDFFIDMSLYYKHIAMIYKHFPHENVKLVRYEDFKSRTAEVCAEIFGWMNVDKSFIPDTQIKYNTTHINRSPSYGKLVSQMLSNHNPLKKIARRIMPGKMDYKVGEMIRNINKTKRTYDPLSGKMEKMLVEFYSPYNDQLSHLTGMDFSDWNKLK